MSERERFEARFPAAEVFWDDEKQDYETTSMSLAWLVWQAARSGQAASGARQEARSDVQNGVGQPEAPTAAPLEPFRAALADLVELENLRIRAGTISPVEPGCEREVLMDEWRRRIRPAWSNARAVLATHPPALSGAGSEEGQG